MQSTVSQNTSLQGRDQTYVMPAAVGPRRSRWCRPTRPTFATPTTETFADLDQRAFRANLFVVVGTVLFVLAALLAVLALVRALLALPEAGGRHERD